MKIDIEYETASFDPDRFKKIIEVVSEYAKSQQDVVVCASDTELVCHYDGYFVCCHDDKNLKKKKNNCIPSDRVKTNTRKCKNCDKEFEPKRKTESFCSGECRTEYYNHRKTSRKQREDTPINEYICPVCGEKFVKHHHKQKCCTQECQKLYSAWIISNHRNPIDLVDFLKSRNAKLADKKMRANLTQRQCANPGCGKMFKPSLEDQKYCCRECKDSAHEQRKAQKVLSVARSDEKRKHVCEVCKMPYYNNKEDSRFCPKCLDSFGEEECTQLVIEEAEKKKAIEEAAKVRFKVCPSCGKNFEAKQPNQFFCDKCTDRALKVKKIKPLKSK